jgi:Cu/Ag efflux pump CusA
VANCFTICPKQTPEVESVAGKLGRAETPTDPAPAQMIETIVMTVATIVASLLPILWSNRAGAEVMKPLGAANKLIHHPAIQFNHSG